MSIPLKLQYKIGDIEFVVEGAPEDVEKQRQIFVEGVLPSAVEAMVRTHNSMRVQQLNNSVQPANLPESAPIPLIEAPTANDDKKYVRTSLAEYVKQLGDIAETDFVLAAAYFHEVKKSTRSFSTANVKQWYSDARRTETSNVSGTVNYLAKKGLIMDDPDAPGQNPKCYIITTSGLEYIENFKPKEKNKTEKRATQKPQKTRVKNESPYEHLTIDDLCLEKYPPLTKIKDAKDKVSLLMYIMFKENQGEWFTINDLVLLLNKKLGESLTDDQIKGVFRHHPRWFLSENTGGRGNEKKHKLQNEGKANAEKVIEEYIGE